MSASASRCLESCTLWSSQWRYAALQCQVCCSVCFVKAVCNMILRNLDVIVKQHIRISHHESDFYSWPQNWCHETRSTRFFCWLQGWHHIIWPFCTCQPEVLVWIHSCSALQFPEALTKQEPDWGFGIRGLHLDKSKVSQGLTEIMMCGCWSLDLHHWPWMFYLTLLYALVHHELAHLSRFVTL